MNEVNCHLVENTYGMTDSCNYPVDIAGEHVQIPLVQIE